MERTIIINLIYNIALLLTLAIVSSTFQSRVKGSSVLNLILSGICIGIAGLLIMSTAVRLSSGVIFDSRSILISVTGMFFGLVPAIIAATIMAIYRIVIGGPGMYMGVLVILTTAAIGVLWHYYRFRLILNSKKTYEFYIFGLITHLDMLLCMLALPKEQMFFVFINTALPIIILYPIGTYLLCILLSERKKSEEEKTKQTSLILSLIDSIPDLIFFKDVNGIYLGCNVPFSEFVGQKRDDIIGKTDYDLFQLEVAEFFRLQDNEMLKVKKERRNEEWVTYPDGRRVLLYTLKTPYWGVDGTIIGILGISRDITSRKQAEEDVIKQNDLFVSLLKLLPVGVFMVDAVDGKPLVVNDMGKTLLGSGILPDANEHNLSEVYKAYKGDTQMHYPTSEMPITLGMKGISAHIEDMVVERPDGTRRLLEVFGTPVFDKRGDPWASLVTFMDITERKQVESELIYLAYHDQLTGLYNRRYFEETVKRLDAEENLPLSIIMADTNGLKVINDSFGHDTGDELLKKAASVIKQACSAEDIIVRYGGDEFVILLLNTNDAETLKIASSIKEITSQEKIANIELSISYGYATKHSMNESIMEILANAENHMYRHKLTERLSLRSKQIEIIMNTLFEKSHRESRHSLRVSKICEAIADKMNFGMQEKNQMRVAGLVHDIGKIGIDEKILNKSGKLDSNERVEIERHPEAGWRILNSSSEFVELAKYVLHHHERWDGKGYPNKLIGENIPIEARIIAVADTYDAMTSERSYKAASSHEEAIKELQRCSGTQFDPDIVDVFANQVAPYSYLWGV